MQSNLRAVQNGGDLGVLKAVVCGATDTITYVKDQKTGKMMKIGIHDGTAPSCVLIFDEKFFAMAKEAAVDKKTIKLVNYRYQPNDQTIVVGTSTKCSVLYRPSSLSDDQIKDGELAMYPRMQPLLLASKSPVKSRISTSGKIVKIFRNEKCKRVLLKDDDHEAFVTLWQPQMQTQMEVGQTLTLYDARISKFQGGSIDTTSGTCVKVLQSEPTIEIVKGQVIGLGQDSDHHLVEVMHEGATEETTYALDNENILSQLNDCTLPVNAELTLFNQLVTEITIDEVIVE